MVFVGATVTVPGVLPVVNDPPMAAPTDPQEPDKLPAFEVKAYPVPLQPLPASTKLVKPGRERVAEPPEQRETDVELSEPPEIIGYTHIGPTVPMSTGAQLPLVAYT